MKALVEGIVWNARLGAKFFWAVPGATSVVVIATLISQISMILAFLLPLKVILLLGSNGTPRFFPAALGQIDREELVIWLSIAAIAFYLLNLLADRVATWGAERGASRLLARSRKMVLFEGQDRLASESYKRYASALAGAVFVTLAMAVLFWLYPDVAKLFIGYSLVVAAILALAQTFSSQLQERLQEAANSWMRVVAALGFMLAFGYLVVDFLYGDPPGFIPAIIALLLSRQAFSRLSGMIPAWLQLYRKQRKLDALFFYQPAYVPEADRERGEAFDVLVPEARSRWVPDVLIELVGMDSSVDVDIRWWPTGVSGVYALVCGARGESDRYLIKLFSTNRSAQARHEADLLADSQLRLPAPAWRGVTEVFGWRCHVFQLPSGSAPKNVRRKQALSSLRERLLEIKAPKAMVARYGRSRTFLWQRISQATVAELHIAARPALRERIFELEDRMQEWRLRLAEIPVTFTSPDIRPGSVMYFDDIESVLIHWGRWSLEPAGTGWPATRAALSQLDRSLAQIDPTDDRFRHIRTHHLHLAAYTSSLEESWKKQKYAEALACIVPILTCLDHAALEDDDGGGSKVEV